MTGDGAGELLIGAGTNPSLTGFTTFGERRIYLLDGTTGELIQSLTSPYAGESMGWNVTAVKNKQGALRNLVAGVRREQSLTGRVFAFPVRRLKASKSDDGCRVTLISTDKSDYELQVSADLKSWKILTTLPALPKPATFIDKEASSRGLRFYRASGAAPPP